MNQPKISILIAARNEEQNIVDLLRSIEQFEYPKAQLQVLIGDDASTDNTAKIIQEFIAQKPHYQLVSINTQVANLRGKANVLAQLAHLATAEFYFFTDADIELPKTWIAEMLSSFSSNSSNVGVVTGSTVIDYKNTFQACQAIEWLAALSCMTILEKYKIPVTGMGNNMAVSAEAYWAVGGYEKIGFSIVEDYALFKAIVEKGFEFRQVFSEKILAKTKAPKNISAYFDQRKRWLAGGFESKSILLKLAFFQAIFLPILLIVSLLSIKFTFGLWAFHFIFQTFFCIKMLSQIKQQNLIKYLLAFDLYMLVFTSLQLIYYFLPTKINWKDRTY